MGQGSPIQEGLEVICVESGIDALIQPLADIRAVVVNDGVEEELLEALLLKDLAKDVEDAPLESRADRFQLGKEAVVDLALSGLLGDEIPQVANLLLADAMNAAEALLQAIRIPWEVVVHHEVRVLKVHAFASGICGNKDANLGIGTEESLPLAALVTLGAAMDGGDRAWGAKHTAHLLFQIVQSIPVLGEDDELAEPASCVPHAGVVLENLGEFIPLSIQAGRDNLTGLLLQFFENENLGFQLSLGLRSRGVVDEFLFEFLLLLGSEIVVVIWNSRFCSFAATGHDVFFTKLALQAFFTATKRLKNRLWA